MAHPFYRGSGSVIKKMVLGALIVFFGLICASLYILLVSREGIRLSVMAADRFLPGQFVVDSIQGSLFNRFVLEGFHYSDGTDVISIDRIAVSWVPAAMLRKELAISSLEIRGAHLEFPSETDNAIAEENFSFPSFTLPMSIKIAHGRVDSLAVKTTEDTPAIQITSIVVNNLAGKGNLIQLGNCEIISDQLQLAAHGQLQTSDAVSTSLHVDYTITPLDLPSFSGNGVVNGSLDELRYETHFLTPFIANAKGVVSDLTGDLTWKGTIQADQLISSHLNKDWPEVVLTELQVSGEGTLASYSLRATTNAAYESFQDLRVSLSMNSGGRGGSTGDGVGVPDGSFDELVYEAHFITPFIGSVKGVVSNLSKDLTWKGALQVDQLILSHLNKDWPEVVLTELQTTAEGTLASYSLRATTNAAYESFQDITVSADIYGEDSGLEIRDVLLGHKQSVLKGKGQLTWRDMLSWRASLTGNGINPVLYNQQWPGSLNLEAVISGQFRDGEVKADLDLIQLDGELRGFPVSVTGKIAVEGTDFTIDALSIQSSDSFLRTSGRFADTVALDFKLESSNLATVWPGFSGSMEATAQVSGSRQQPEFQFDLAGDAIAVGETTMGDVRASGTGVFTSEGAINASFSATEVAIAGTMLETIEADLKGTPRNHSFAARVNTPHAAATFNLAGGYSAENWKGILRSAAVETDFINNWQLRQPVPITLSLNNGEIGSMCLSGVQSSQVCIAGKYEQAGSWSATADITALPVELFRDMQNRFSELGGTFSGTAHLNGLGAEIVDGVMNLSADTLSARLDFSEEYNHEIVWENNSVHAALAGNTLEVKIRSMLRDKSIATAEAVFSDIGIVPFSIEKTGIQGSLHLDIKDLQSLTAIIYPDIEPSGTLKGDLEFNGKLTQPDLLGQARLEQGTLILPALGITVKDVEMRLDGKENRLRLAVNATSGGGTIHGESVYQFVAAVKNQPVELIVTGENFEILNLPEARIKVSPDLKLKISTEQGNLQGKIVITEAYYFPGNFEGTVSPSKDIVFVDDLAKQQETAWPLYADITLVAGEDVRINAFGLRGWVGGQLQIMDQPAKTVTGEGSLNIRKGTFSIYGRQLTIVNGRLLYSGNPLDNPGIDVRAENTAGGVITGIQVSGFLREPDVSFYSTPPMEQDAIIRRLLTNTSLIGSSEEEGFLGSVASDTGMDPLAATVQDVKKSLRVDDIKIEAGKTTDDLSLVIGTWLTPRLYVSYGKNLLKESGNFNTRYVLGHGFSMQTESGATQSGADLMYEIDK